MQHRSCYYTLFNHILVPSLPQIASAKTIFHSPSCVALPPSYRSIHHRSRRPRLANALVPSDRQKGDTTDSDSDTEVKKSRNQKKREARRAFQWGVDLASFSTPKIKRILKAASLDEDVFDALMLVKRLGPEVREGKRRQFNYIGKLLREVEPDLMDTLIRATKDGDQKTLQALAGSTPQVNACNGDELEEMHCDDQEQMSQVCISKATRWFSGLISKDMKVTNEVYSLDNVDFDRQELRKLVRRVHSVQEQCMAMTEETEENVNAAVMAAENSLTHFLYVLASQTPSE